MFTSALLKAAHTLKAVHGWANALKLAFKAVALKAKIAALKIGEQIQIKFFSKKAGEVVTRFAVGTVESKGTGKPSPLDSVVFMTADGPRSAKIENLIL
jgi:hypothetical protein